MNNETGTASSGNKHQSSLRPHVWTAPKQLPPMDPLLVHFYRQYVQQVQNLIYPPAQLLIHMDVQEQVYKHFFDGPLKGPPEYQRKVLKRVIDLIESQIKDPDQDEVSNNLMEHIGYLSTIPSKPLADSAAETQILTYTVPTEYEVRAPPRILIEESPQLLAAGSNVGLRTWEAALHLATYLHTSPDLVKGKNVLELGAGTGLVSILCAGVLDAQSVLATDGLPHVIDALEKNILRNRVSLFSSQGTDVSLSAPAMPAAKVLDWGSTKDELEEILESDEHDPVDYDLILGADITYSPDVVPVLASLLKTLMANMFPATKMMALISATVRNEATLSVFAQACKDMSLHIEHVQFECPTARSQRGFFHEQGFPIVIMKITSADQQ